jgi:hypothetical protein
MLWRSNCSVRAWDPNWNALRITNMHACLCCQVKCLDLGGTFHSEGATWICTGILWKLKFLYGYLDLRAIKWRETGENYFTRNVTIRTLYLLKRYEADAFNRHRRNKFIRNFGWTPDEKRLVGISRTVVFNLFCSHTPRYIFSSTLYPQSCWCII